MKNVFFFVFRQENVAGDCGKWFTEEELGTVWFGDVF
jgi:hypothetical protein